MNSDGIAKDDQPLTPHESEAPTGRTAENSHPDVVSVRAAGTGDFVTLNAFGRHLENVQLLAAPANRPASVNFPFGLFSFTLGNVTPGGSATVQMVLPADARPEDYYKLKPASDEFSRFDFDGTTGAVINGNVVMLHLVDGGRGDADGQANGVIEDPGGPVVSGGVVTLSCKGSDGLQGWYVAESGGSGAGRGSVTVDRGAQVHELVLREGNSFRVSLEGDIVVPPNPSMLTFDYTTSFDTTDPQFINDAFEVSLVDGDGLPVVPIIEPHRDSFLNATQGEAVARGSATTLSGQTVSLDISKLLPGSTARLIFRLVNDDSDPNTTGIVPWAHSGAYHDQFYI